MTSIAIEDLFNDDRLPGGLALLPVLLYFPLGLCLALLRFFIGFHAFVVSCFLPKTSSVRSHVLRMMCGVLGIIVKKEDMEIQEGPLKMIVANHITTLDHLAIDLVTPSILPSVWDLPPALMWILGYRDMGAKQGRETLINNAKKHCQGSTVPLLAFPEGASTNGHVGLLKFSVWPFSLDQPICPIIVKVHRPSVTNISLCVLGGRWWLDIFWFLFVPYTSFHIKMLPAVKQGEDEAVEEFTRRVQGIMAEALGVQATPFTSADKVEYAKRKIFVARDHGGATSRMSSASGVTDPQELMCYQVKEVLPHVPLLAIRQDLAMTKDVDLTITNIIEGRVEFRPEEPGVDSTPSPLSSRPASPPFNVTLSSQSSPSSLPASFAKSHHDRENSLDYRKKMLLDSARQKYLEKHGML